MKNYGKPTKGGRVKFSYAHNGRKNRHDIYARPEQLDPYLCEYGFFAINQFLAHLDSFRTCGFVAHVPLDNIRVIKPAKAIQPEMTSDEFKKVADKMNRIRKDEKDRRRNRQKLQSWQVYRVQG